MCVHVAANRKRGKAKARFRLVHHDRKTRGLSGVAAVGTTVAVRLALRKYPAPDAIAMDATMPVASMAEGRIDTPGLVGFACDPLLTSSE